MSTTAQTISNCISYANSTKAAVGFAVMVTEGEAIRRNIQDGKYEGVSFPDPPKAANKPPRKRPHARKERIRMVSAVHSLRRDGLSAVNAAKLVGVPYQTYAAWVVEERMPYEGTCLRGQFN